MSREEYLAIPPGAIMPGSMPNFKIYMLSPAGQYVLWTLEGNRVTTEQLEKLSESGQKEVFIDLDEQFKYEEYLEAHLDNILGNEGPSDDQKAAIFSRVSTNVVKHAFESSFGFRPISTDVLQRTQAMIEKALIFIAESKSLQALAKIVGHDYETYEHATKVLWFTVGFLSNHPEALQRVQPGEELEESQRLEVLRLCGVAALLHDIGKTLVAPEILHKNGLLTEIEWEIMKRHPFNGLAMLLDTDLPGFVKKGVLHHHEDFCGGGYPMGLEGEDIPVLPRVLRIVDTFDAMTSRRPYKDPIPPYKAAQIMTGKAEGNRAGADLGQDVRDQGMRQCFDEDLLRKFIVFLGHMKLANF